MNRVILPALLWPPARAARRAARVARGGAKEQVALAVQAGRPNGRSALPVPPVRLGIRGRRASPADAVQVDRGPWS